MNAEFEKELTHLINRHSIENELDMPDFLLARMMCAIIESMGPTVKATLDWHGCDSVCHPRPNNLIGNEANVVKALMDVLETQHRTLQQSYFKLIVVPSIIAFAKKHEEGYTDLRNSASCELASVLKPMVEDIYLPFV